MISELKECCPNCKSIDFSIVRDMTSKRVCSECCFNWYPLSYVFAEKKENKMEMPTIGRIVLYQKYGSPNGEHKPEPSPAIVTKVKEDGTTCHLFIMNPTGCYFNETPFSEELKPGHWSWMAYQKERYEKNK